MPIQDMPNKTIPIYVIDEDAKKFILFQQHFELFSTLLAAGVFVQKNAQIVLNFDNNGVLQVIERKDRLYSRRHLSTG